MMDCAMRISASSVIPAGSKRKLVNFSTKAAVIAEAEGVATSTIHNRLQLARAGKYLDTPGKGARK